jgi:hypothetical protein
LLIAKQRLKINLELPKQFVYICIEISDMAEKKQIATSISVVSIPEILRHAKKEQRSFSLMVDILLKEALTARSKKSIKRTNVQA